MKKSIGILMLGVIVLAAAACGNSVTPASSQSPAASAESQTPAPSKPASATEDEAPTPAEEPSESAGDTEQEQTPESGLEGDLVASLKKEQIIGKNNDEVADLYGKPQAVADANQYLMWRYDFAEEGYRYGEKVISVDVQGLTSKKMRAQLFVEYGDDKIADAYSVYFLKADEVMQYRVTKDGADEYPASAD